MNSDAHDVHQEMLEHMRARELPQALGAAERFLALTVDIEDPDLRSLRAGTTATWVQLKTAVEPKNPELPTAFEEIYERYSDDDAPEGIIVAITALCTRIHVLIGLGRTDDAVLDATRVTGLFRSRPLSINRAVAANQLLLGAYYLIAAQLPMASDEVARAVVDVLAGSDEPAEALLAAVGQVWVAIATMYGAPTRTDASMTDPNELADLSVEELKEFSPIIDEVERLQAMGENAIKAIDVTVGRLQQSGQWNRALITILATKVEILRELDQPQALRAAMTQFIDTCSDIERWNAPVLVQEYQKELGDD